VAIPSAIDVSGDITAAATALAGLILVFLGSTSTSYDSYQKTEQGAVRRRYQRRAWFAFVGFVLALLSAFFALVGKWLHQECASLAGIALFVVALAWALFAALSSVKEIK
jgi:peptidoglycan/LPS O-acetylase OafA/YrhL